MQNNITHMHSKWLSSNTTFDNKRQSASLILDFISYFLLGSTQAFKW